MAEKHAINVFLESTRDSPESLPPKVAIVFVHGILSDHKTFKESFRLFEGLRQSDCELAYFDYDYNRHLIDNGKALADALWRRYGNDFTEVSLVCHSMGGMVARLAILIDGPPLKFVKKIFLLGTPNRGAFRTSQLGPLFQSALRSGVVRAVFNRKPGILDLTKTLSIFKAFENSAWRADQIVYISMAGCYFHQERPHFDIANAREAPLAALSLLLPLKRPHDGVVERSSNCLVPCEAGSWSEKSSSINHFSGKSQFYAHIEHRACEDLTHGRLQSSPELLQIIWDLVNCRSFDEWAGALSLEQKRVLRYEPHYTQYVSSS